MFVTKRPKINEKEAGDGPFKKQLGLHKLTQNYSKSDATDVKWTEISDILFRLTSLMPLIVLKVVDFFQGERNSLHSLIMALLILVGGHMWGLTISKW